jgi:hypothetical protein
MSNSLEVHHVPAITNRNSARRPTGLGVAGWSEHLWAMMQGALRQRSRPGTGRSRVVTAPLDFAAAMRRVEVEVYDAV